MEYGGSGRRRLVRVLVIGAAVGALCAVAASIAVPLLRERSQHSLDERARREARQGAQLVRTTLLGSSVNSPGELRETAEEVDGVKVLAVTGEDRAEGAGIQVLFEVRVRKLAPTLFGYQRTTVVACYQQVVSNSLAPAALTEEPCPVAGRAG